MQEDKNVVELTPIEIEIGDPLAEFANEVTAALEAHRNGGPNLKEVHVERAKVLGLNAEAIADVELRWKANAVKAKPPIWVRPLSAAPEPKPKPKPATNADADVGPPKIEAALKVSAGTKPKPEAGFAERLGEAIAIAKPKPEPKEPEEEPEDEPGNVERVRLPAVIPVTKPLSSERVSRWDDAMAAMNEQHAIIENVGNKTVIASWEPSPTNLDRRVLVFQGKD